MITIANPEKYRAGLYERLSNENIEEDFAQWYTDVVRKAELADYTESKGCIAIRPYGYAIWENIQNYADKKFKEVGVKNISMPLLIPERLLQKEKDHVEGFAPEVAIVTEAGGETLDEKLIEVFINFLIEKVNK